MSGARQIMTHLEPLALQDTILLFNLQEHPLIFFITFVEKHGFFAAGGGGGLKPLVNSPKRSLCENQIST